ncbi:MAG: YhbY family RNA-binding protein [Desulfurococcales archaeon]|nr:YhbY family RNA-binding protein [Desulfurococcales archaeon]
MDKEKLHQMEVDVIIGKRGLDEGVIEEVKRRLKKKRFIKVKMLRSTLIAEDSDRKSIAKELASKAGAELIGIKGRTVILKRKANFNKR